MSYALGEVEALAKKATRGAGYSWGMAEEAGKATRALCALGLDGCAALVDVLQRFDGTTATDCSPLTTDGSWRAEQGDLCPLYLGTALSDRAGFLSAEPIKCESVVQPLLLIPFVINMAHATGDSFTIRTPGAQVHVGAKGVSIHGAIPDTAAELSIEADGTIANPRDVRSRAFPDPADWEALSAFAHRTYAPATEESRLKGAG